MNIKNWCTGVPEFIGDIYIGYCCELHDKAYWKLYDQKPTKDNKAKRKKADKSFRGCIYKTLRIQETKHCKAYIYSRLFYVAVRMFGSIGLWKR